MFEISCLYNRPEFWTIQYDAYNDWVASPSTNPLEPGLVQQMKDKHNINVQGQYYFVEQNGSLVPVWDFRSSGENRGRSNAIVYAKKIKSTPSPNGSDNLDWVELEKVSGDLANRIYRVETVKGLPPSSVSSFPDFVPVL